ncbi:hypothetical protein [Okeania sp. KiyG1]|uniref:hypothetical protein n=1 Tax=Okeania sp. KiyG1 TaxID=2720165 RepID=UPI001920E36C|nr:hypothetical protein [Okeania sp. KiyG1]
MSHAYHIAKSIGVDRIYLPQFWYIKEGELTTPSGILIFNLNQPNFFREKIVLEGVFCDYKTLAPLSKTTPEHYLNMIDLIGAGAFNFQHSEPLGEQDLVIHIRSGDIFKNNVHLGYGQPPFSFYAKIIELQSWHSISLVFEDKSNPIIDPLIDFCRQRCSQVQEISSDLKSDIEYLLKARKLVVSNGTFCPAIALISKSLNTVYSFENEFSIKYNPNISQIVRVVDRQGVYKS